MVRFADSAGRADDVRLGKRQVSVRISDGEFVPLKAVAGSVLWELLRRAHYYC